MVASPLYRGLTIAALLLAVPAAWLAAAWSDVGAAPLGELAPLPADAPPSAPSSAIVLPVEVLSDGAPVVVEVPFELGSAAGLDRLYLQVHRPAYRDASVNPGRGPKASVRLNGGPWVGLTDAEATAVGPDAAYGGLASGLFTVRMTVPLARLGGAQDGGNVVSFRFNGTDGFTVGYRVLGFNVLDASGAPALGAGAFTDDDPAAWTAPRPSAADVAEGKRLWETAPIVEQPGGPALRATCASCHAADARDLWYFNYSNHSIEARSRFHGLSPAEAAQIASYVRSLSDSGPTYAYAAPGRPWNPPYQPGPGLDARPAHEWAAGAGLEWVLDRDEDALDHVVATRADGLPAMTLEEAVATTADLNVRETPVSLQFPDWNAWLPEVHPVDLWGDQFLSHVAGQNYDRARTAFATDRQAEIDRDQNDPNGLGTWPLQKMYDGATQFWRNDGAIDFGNDPTSLLEAKHRSLYHWVSVKSWELSQEFDLETLGPEVYGHYGEPRTWLGSARPLFELAPHLSTHKRDVAFTFQSDLVGKTASTAWYQLQLVVNAGNGVQSGTIAPVDWNYHPDHIGGLAGYGGPAHPVRYLLSFARMAQLHRLTRPDGSSGDADRRTQMVDYQGVVWGQVHPGRVLSGLPGGTPGPRIVGALDAFLASFMGWAESIPAGAWPRRPDVDGDGAVCDEPFPEHEWLQPSSWDGDRYSGSDGGHCNEDWGTAEFPTSYSIHARRHAQNWYWAIPRYRTLGVSEATLGRMIGWGESMWPLGAWGDLRAVTETVTATRTLQTGWNVVALPVSLDGAALDALFAATPSLVLLKDVDGRIYQPVQDIRNVDRWDARQAYSIFAREPTTFQVSGPVEPVIVLREGWNLFPYRGTEVQPWREALGPILHALDYVDGGAGQVYDPANGVDDDFSLAPGRGYLVHTTEAVTMTP